MAGVMTMRSGNPALTADTFAKYRAVPGAEQMTLGGTVNKTALSLAILLVAASYVWNRGADDPSLGAWIMVSVVAGLVVALVTVFKQTWAPYTTPVYAALEGVALGGISVVFEARYPGIVSQAVFLTFGTLGALLVAYRSGVIRATENFKLGVVAATGGIALLYLLSFVLGFFGVNVPLIHSSGTFGILFSVFVVVIAALNLVLDFDFIEQGVERGAPKHMEWYGAFGLLVTLVWLYLEILHLLAKLQSRALKGLHPIVAISRAAVHCYHRGMALDERTLFTDRPETRPGRYQCPKCRRTGEYSIRWVRRSKKDRLPAGADEGDRVKFAKLRDHLLRLDDEVTCKACGRKFEIPSQHSLMFVDQLAGLPNEDELEREINVAAGEPEPAPESKPALPARFTRKSSGWK